MPKRRASQAPAGRSRSVARARRRDGDARAAPSRRGPRLADSEIGDLLTPAHELRAEFERQRSRAANRWRARWLRDTKKFPRYLGPSAGVAIAGPSGTAIIWSDPGQASNKAAPFAVRFRTRDGVALAPIRSRTARDALRWAIAFVTRDAARDQWVDRRLHVDLDVGPRRRVELDVWR